jgi:Protein of unknown function (DUF1566)/Head domain of trimeric autotransporter adhesin
MKTKLFLSALLSFSFCLLSSQIPQGFNYQAIARDGSGNPIAGATIKVKLSILSDTTGFYLTGGSPASYIWEEEQTNVKTNAFGLFTVVFGNPNATKIQGTAAGFSAIDWAKTPLYIGTKIANPTNYKIMGSAKLWSVPYSMVTDSTKALLKGSKLSVVSSDDQSSDALFEVKRKDGQTVFAVYPDSVNIFVPQLTGKGATKGGFAIGSFDTGKSSSQRLFVVNPDSVRVYIDTNPAKGATKGGFAIGSFDATKAVHEEYLRVTRDSTRVYINNLQGKGATKGGFAIGGFDQGKGGNANFFNVETSSTEIINPSQNRILWYPAKNAFLTGKILIEKPDSVGENSFASGYESKAVGQFSQALGYQAIARGVNSTSIGYQSIANKNNSFAFGQFAQAQNAESYAFGRGALAEGLRSFAFGSAGIDSTGLITGVAYAKGDYSFTIGQGSQSLGKGAFAFGLADTARGNYSLAIGYKTSATGNGAVSIGTGSIASDYYATAMGYKTTASGQFSTAMGTFTVANTNNATAMGSLTTASGQVSTAMGAGSIASGGISTALGCYSTASQFVATAMGYNTLASANVSTAMGNGTSATGYVSTAMGSGTIASGQYSTSMGNTTTASGNMSISMGFYTTAQSYASAAFGRYNVVSGDDSNWYPTDPLFVIGNGTSSSSPSNAVTVLKNGNVGIGTSMPATILDVNGVINLNNNNITNVATPVNVNDAVNKVYVDNSNPVHTIGESYGGGVVFYVYDNGRHGLISATIDQGTNIQWYNGTIMNTTANRDCIGAGMFNTERIIIIQGSGSYAAQVCSVYTGGNFGNWYLPSKYELNLLYAQKTVVGGFANANYWCSDENNSSQAYYQNFLNGTSGFISKSNSYNVRAIRCF